MTIAESVIFLPSVAYSKGSNRNPSLHTARASGSDKGCISFYQLILLPYGLLHPLPIGPRFPIGDEFGHPDGLSLWFVQSAKHLVGEWDDEPRIWIPSDFVTDDAAIIGHFSPRASSFLPMTQDHLSR